MLNSYMWPLATMLDNINKYFHYCKKVYWTENLLGAIYANLIDLHRYHGSQGISLVVVPYLILGSVSDPEITQNIMSL